MANQRDGISYCDETYNVATGCSPVSSGCRSCWAKGMVHRMQTGVTTGPRNGALCQTVEWNGRVELMPHWLAKPLHWSRPRVVLVQTLGDLFHDGVPFEFIAAVYGVMAACPHLTFLVLTKRPERMLEFYRWAAGHGGIGKYLRSELGRDSVRGLFASGSKFETYRGRKCRSSKDAWAQVLNSAAVGPAGENVWAGISAENQAELEKRWVVLRQVPAARYWLSAEPLLGALSLERAIHRCHSGQDGECFWEHCPQLRDGEPERSGRHCPLDDDRRDDAIDPRPPRLSFVAVGCETGHSARPCDVEHVRSVVRQCQSAGVPVHVKALPVCRLGRECMHVPGVCKTRVSKDPREWPEDLRIREEVPR